MVLAHQQGADLEAGRVAGQQVATEVVQRQAAVDDVLDDDDIAIGKVQIQVLDDADHPR